MKNEFNLATTFIILLVAVQSHATDYVVGAISRVHAGSDNWYGVRFYIDIEQDLSHGVCNTAFIYTEPKPDNGHDQKVSVFLAAYMAGKKVSMTVTSGRGEFCELVEGSTL